MASTRAPEPEDLTLEDHRRRAGGTVDAAITAAGRHVIDLPSIPEVRVLHQAPPDELRSIIVVLLDRATSGGSIAERMRGFVGGMPAGWAASQVLGSIGNRRAAFSRGDVHLMLALASQALRRTDAANEWMVVGLAGQPVLATERAVKAGGVAGLEGEIRTLADALGQVREYSVTQAMRYRARLLGLLQPALDEAGATITVEPSLVSVDDTWGVAWRASVAGLSSPEAALFVHCSLASGVTPSASWRRLAGELARGPGCAEMLQAMLADARASASVHPPQRFEYDGRVYITPYPAIVDANAVLLRGAMWAAATTGELWVVETLTAIGLYFGTSGGSSNVARDERLANTAAAALGSLTGPDAIAGLGRMKAKVTNRNVSKQIAKALDGAAGRAGITASELLELSVPSHGLDAEGRVELPVGDHVAVLALEGDDVTLGWRTPDGRVTARPPVAIAGDKAAIARVKEEHKELRRSLAVERGRVEDLFVEDRAWTAADWRARYVEHPLTGSIGRRLIWTIRTEAGTTTAMVGDGTTLVTADGTQVEAGADAQVRLWHPIDAPEAAIAAWRTRLLDARIRQPFKQAFREVYLLTPAEEDTDDHSNRFAAHILRYPQARALMTVRRWASNFLGPYDGGYDGIARREFATHGLRAEFWHEAIEDELQDADGTARHCTTDQVRFVRLRPVEELMHLRDVPPIVFSEAMRDVDLFVSVTSVGADRNWQDGGRERDNAFAGYWGSYWDEPLSATSGVRRDALARMLPALAIADRLELRDRWLVVRGDLRTYRIHLGSGNIMMEPSDTYLCIVPARGGASDKVFLPFDDDPTLSVILSKAFLLAKDSRVTDRSIVAQIRRG